MERCRWSKEIVEDRNSMLVGLNTDDQARDGTARWFRDHVKAQSQGDVMRRKSGSAGQATWSGVALNSRSRFKDTADRVGCVVMKQRQMNMQSALSRSTGRQ